jgi:glycosyltransferase involved in cell wall biosynthesis
LKSKKNGIQKPKQVLFVWNYLEWGGAQIYFLALMKEAKKHCEIRAVMPEGSNRQLLKFLDDLEIPCDFVPAFTDSRPATGVKRKLQRHFNKLRSEYKFCRHLKKYDLRNSVVHTDFAPWQSFGALLWLSLRTRSFVTVHNSVFPTQKWRHWIWKFKLGVLSKLKNFRIFTANEDAKKCLRGYVAEEFYDSIEVTSASINPAEIEEAVRTDYDRYALKQKFRIPNGKFLVFCVGQFIDRKGRWIFLEAARKLVEKESDIAFVWISNSKPPSEDLEKAAAFGLGEDFVFITSEQVGKERSDLFRLIQLADVYALPSFVEGLPISLLEAMALEKPVISTNINGIPEAVKHLKTGYLIESGNAEELAFAIRKLKDDIELRLKLGKAARKYIIENFDERETAKKAWQSYLQSFQNG